MNTQLVIRELRRAALRPNYPHRADVLSSWFPAGMTGEDAFAEAFDLLYDEVLWPWPFATNIERRMALLFVAEALES